MPTQGTASAVTDGNATAGLGARGAATQTETHTITKAETLVAGYDVQPTPVKESRLSLAAKAVYADINGRRFGDDQVIADRGVSHRAIAERNGVAERTVRDALSELDNYSHVNLRTARRLGVNIADLNGQKHEPNGDNHQWLTWRRRFHRPSVYVFLPFPEEWDGEVARRRQTAEASGKRKQAAAASAYLSKSAERVKRQMLPFHSEGQTANSAGSLGVKRQILPSNQTPTESKRNSYRKSEGTDTRGTPRPSRTKVESANAGRATAKTTARPGRLLPPCPRTDPPVTVSAPLLREGYSIRHSGIEVETAVKLGCRCSVEGCGERPVAVAKKPATRPDGSQGAWTLWLCARCAARFAREHAREETGSGTSATSSVGEAVGSHRAVSSTGANAVPIAGGRL